MVLLLPLAVYATAGSSGLPSPRASTTFISELFFVPCVPLHSLGIVHTDSHSSPFSAEFLLLLDCFNITQHVKDTTLGPEVTSSDLHCVNPASCNHHAFFLCSYNSVQAVCQAYHLIQVSLYIWPHCAPLNSPISR